jgi:hypothetical protein
MKKTIVIKQIIYLMVFSLSLIGCISTQVNYVTEPIPFNEASFLCFFDSHILGFHVDGDDFSKRTASDVDFGSLPISPWVTPWWYIPTGIHTIRADYLNPYSGVKGTVSGSFNFQPGQYYEIYTTGNFNPSLNIRTISGYTKGGIGKAIARGEKRIADRAGTIGNSAVDLSGTLWVRSLGQLSYDIIYFLDENRYERTISSTETTNTYQRNGDEIILDGIGKFQMRGGVLLYNTGTKRIYFKRNIENFIQYFEKILLQVTQ